MPAKKIIRRRALIRLASFTIAAITALFAFGISSHNRAESYHTAIKYSNQRSLAELNEYMSNIDIALKKSIYTSSPSRFRETATMLWRDSSCAKEALESLPTKTEDTEKLYRFLSQTGDYAMYLSRCLENGDTPDDMTQSLSALSDCSAGLKSAVGRMSLDIQQGLDFSDELEEVDTPTISDGFYDVEDELTSYPTLIYDGPFSDQIYEKQPEMLKNEKEIDKEIALETAYILCPDASELNNEYDANGTIPCYVFGGENYSVSISKHGGLPVYMTYDHKVGTGVISTEQAGDYAAELLEKLGMREFKQTGYEIYDDICTFNYAYVHNDVVCYPDLVKISVALDDGTVVSFDAAGYIMNHKERSIPGQVHTREKAKEKLSKALSVQNIASAYIPTDGAKEALCYEFRCTGSAGDTVLVYINAQTLAEEQVLIVLESQYSSLTI